MKIAAVPAIHRRLTTDLGVVHYWVTDPPGSAERPWLVFLPGLTADHRLFAKQIADFGRDYRCLVWDAPAHGASRPFALRFTMADMADYLHRIFERESIERPVLIGQSLGGYLSQAYMAQYPDSAAGFISVDSCSLKRCYYTDWELYLLKRTKAMYLSIPWRLLRVWGSSGCAETPYGQALMFKMMQDYEKEEYCALADHGYRIFAEAVENENGVDYELHCPTLLLCGEKDAAGSAKDYNRRWTAQDKLPLIWVPGAGHNSNTDQPDFVNRAIREFVEKLA